MYIGSCTVALYTHSHGPSEKLAAANTVTGAVQHHTIDDNWLRPVFSSEGNIIVLLVFLDNSQCSGNVCKTPTEFLFPVHYGQQ